MWRKVMRCGFLAALCLHCAATTGEARQGEITIAAITAQKPQSKLWRDQGTWWAALPQDDGVYLWRYANGRFAPQKTPGPLKGSAADSQCDTVLHRGKLFVLDVQPKAKKRVYYKPAPSVTVIRGTKVNKQKTSG